MRPAAPQEFFGKNSYAHEPTAFRLPYGPSHPPSGTLPADARTPQGLPLLWRLYLAEDQGILADLSGLRLDEYRA